MTLITTTAGMTVCAQADSPAHAVARASGLRGPVPVGRSLWRVPTIVELGQFLNWKVGVPSSAFQRLAFVGGCDQDRRFVMGIRGGLEHSMGEPGDP